MEEIKDEVSLGVRMGVEEKEEVEEEDGGIEPSVKTPKAPNPRKEFPKDSLKDSPEKSQGEAQNQR